MKELATQGKASRCLILGTGSSSLDLEQGADLMPGRRGRRHPVDFELLPVPFRMVKDRLRVADPRESSRMAESLVAAELRRRKGAGRLSYWLGNREIDFVGELVVEVKYQNHVSIEEFAWAETVLGKNQELTVVTRKNNARNGRIRLVDLERWLTSE